MTLTITDTILSAAGTPVVGGWVKVVPTYTPLFRQIAGVWVEYEFGSIDTQTNAAGQYTVSLPPPSQCDPTTVHWSVILPDSTTWQGASQESAVGPITMKQAKDSYGWGLVSAGSAAPPIAAIQGPPGAGGSGTDATTTVVGGVLVDHAPSGAHPVALTTDGTALATGMIGAGATQAVAGNDARVGSIPGQVISPGYIAGTTSGTITTTFGSGVTVVDQNGVTDTITFNADGSITEVFTGLPNGAATRTKTTTFAATAVTETIS